MKQPDGKSSLNQQSQHKIFEDAPLFAGLEDAFWSATAQPKLHQGVSAPEPIIKKKTRNKTAVHKAESRPATLFLSVADICSLLGISRATLIRMDKTNSIPGRVKLGGSVRYHRETIDVWLTELVNKKE